MSKWNLFFIILAVLLILPQTIFSAPFVVYKNTSLVTAPSPDAPKIDSLEIGTIVEVTHQADEFWRVVTADKTGYTHAGSLRQSQTKGGPLTPLVIMAATPLGKIVVTKTLGLFKKLLGIGNGDDTKADEVISVGKELVVLAKEIGGWLKVKDVSGKVGYIKENPNIIYLQPITYADAQVVDIWKNSKPIPSNASDLTLQVQVRKIDGTLVLLNEPLKLGDEYRIYVKLSSDAFVRITCETPNANHTCQYYPNQFQGTQTSMIFKGGYTYSTELLPQGFNFKVSEPIGPKDILRIEATTAGPYHYVVTDDGCVQTKKFKSGGFSVAGTIVNPTAQVIFEYPLSTSK